MKEGYRLTDHTADFGLEIFGTDEASLFRQAALALADMISDPARVSPVKSRRLEVIGDDRADLMVNWLREVLYCWNGRGQLLADVEIRHITARRLTATIFYEDYQPRRHEIRNEIKAVTYHQIEVDQDGDGWVARVIVDI